MERERVSKEELIRRWRNFKELERKHELLIETLSARTQVTRMKKILLRRMTLALQTKISGKVQEIANKYSAYLNLKDEVLQSHRARILMSEHRDAVMSELEDLKESIRMEFGEKEFRQNLNKIRDMLDVVE